MTHILLLLLYLYLNEPLQNVVMIALFTIDISNTNTIRLRILNCSYLWYAATYHSGLIFVSFVILL